MHRSLLTPRRILVGLAVLLLINSMLGPGYAQAVGRPLSNVVKTVLAPVTASLGAVSRTVRPAPGPRRYANDQDLDRIIADRDQALKDARNLQARVRELEAENARLRNLGERESRKGISLIRAGVIGFNGNQRNPVLTIDRGAKAGIDRHQAVELDGNLVGFVSNAGARTADVAVITRYGAQYRALIKSADPQDRPHELTEIVYLGADGESFYVEVNKSQGGAVGDYAHLNDDTGIYPESARGLIIGRVSRVEDSADKPLLMKRLIIRPTMPLTRLSRVEVLVPVEAREGTP